MQLKKIQIENYKGVNNKLVIDTSVNSNKAKPKLSNHLNYSLNGIDLIPKVLGIIGKNASGKSSIISSLMEALNFVFFPNKLFTRFYSEKLNFSMSKINPQQMTNELQNKNIQKINEVASLTFENQKKIFESDYFEFIQNTYFSLSNDQINPLKIELTFVESTDKYIIGFELTSKELKRWKLKNNKEIIDFPIISFNEINFDPIVMNLPVLLNNQIKLLNKIGEKKYNNLLKMIDNNVKKISINKKENRLFFNSLIMNNGSIINYHFLSTGTLKMLEIISQIMFVDERTKLTLIIADEINNFLHSKIVDFLFKLFNHYSINKQLIFSTHSPSVISQIDRHSILFIDKEEGKLIVNKGSQIREANNFYKKFISEEISSHPSSYDINEVLYEWSR